MLISEFARTTGLSSDTVRFYIRKGLIVPDTSRKGGANPYQVFNASHVEMARLIRLAQSLGFSLKEIALLGEEYRAGQLNQKRSAEVIRKQLGLLLEKQKQLTKVITYMQDKLRWLAKGGKGKAPTLETDGHSADMKQKRVVRKP
jgi:MerR family transcriptional regulator, copper efflux regulator